MPNSFHQTLSKLLQLFYWSSKKYGLLLTNKLSGGGMWKGLFWCDFPNDSAFTDMIGCLNSIFKMWPDKHFVQEEKTLESSVTTNRSR